MEDFKLKTIESHLLRLSRTDRYKHLKYRLKTDIPRLT